MNLTPETAPTPVIRQYLALHEGLDENTLLLMRVGDFYEAFCDDAVTAAPLLGLCLTRRAGQPMCGVPYHAIDAYLAKAIRAGKKVALAENAYGTENGIGHREINRVITPGPAAPSRHGSLADAEAHAWRHGYDSETCRADAAECGGL